jgi:hypothetical protein
MYSSPDTSFLCPTHVGPYDDPLTQNGGIGTIDDITGWFVDGIYPDGVSTRYYPYLTVSGTNRDIWLPMLSNFNTSQIFISPQLRWNGAGFPGDRPLGLVSFDLNQILTTGSTTVNSNTSFFVYSSGAVLETAYGGTRPYLYVRTWQSAGQANPNYIPFTMKVLDLTDPARIVEVPTNLVTDFGGEVDYARAWRFWKKGASTYMAIMRGTHVNASQATGRGDVHVFDVTNVSNVSQVAVFDFQNGKNQLAVAGSRMYLMDSKARALKYLALDGFNVTSQGQLFLPETNNSRSASDLWVVGNSLYVGAWENGVVELDISSFPPTIVGAVPVQSASQKFGTSDGAVLGVPTLNGHPDGALRFVQVFDLLAGVLDSVGTLPFARVVTTTTTSTRTTSTTTTSTTASTTSTTATTGRSTTSATSTSSTAATTSSCVNCPASSAASLMVYVAIVLAAFLFAL